MVKSYRTPSQFIPTVQNKCIFAPVKIFACSKLKKKSKPLCYFHLGYIGKCLKHCDTKTELFFFLGIFWRTVSVMHWHMTTHINIWYKNNKNRKICSMARYSVFVSFKFVFWELSDILSHTHWIANYTHMGDVPLTKWLCSCRCEIQHYNHHL